MSNTGKGMNVLPMFRCSQKQTRTPMKQLHTWAEYEIQSLHIVIQPPKRKPFYLTSFPLLQETAEVCSTARRISQRTAEIPIYTDTSCNRLEVTKACCLWILHRFFIPPFLKYNMFLTLCSQWVNHRLLSNIRIHLRARTLCCKVINYITKSFLKDLCMDSTTLFDIVDQQWKFRGKPVVKQKCIHWVSLKSIFKTALKSSMRREGLQIKSVITYPGKSKGKLFSIGYTT